MEAVRLDTHTPTLAESPTSRSDLRPFTMPQGGTDRLHFASEDTIEILGPGDPKERTATVLLVGHYVIERADPTSADWYDASVEIFMRELSVSGRNAKFGHVHASINYDIGEQSKGLVSSGIAVPEIEDWPLIGNPKLCTMNGFMKFELPDKGVTVFNKEAIELTHKIIQIPPTGQGGGTDDKAKVPLYSVDDLDGPPVAILHKVKTYIGEHWVDE